MTQIIIKCKIRNLTAIHLFIRQEYLVVKTVKYNIVEIQKKPFRSSSEFVSNFIEVKPQNGT